jgi:hemerythrin
MELFAWSEKYSVNIKEMDDQHRKLIGMVNALNNAMKIGKGKEVLEKTLKDLIEYTATHFAAEERLMKAHRYPGYEEHKAKHDKMTQKVIEIYNQYQEGRIALTIQVMNFLENWVDKHILGTDKQYAVFLNNAGVK